MNKSNKQCVLLYSQQPPVAQDDTASHPEKRKSTGETPESAKKRKSSKALDVDLPNAPTDGGLKMRTFLQSAFYSMAKMNF